MKLNIYKEEYLIIENVNYSKYKFKNEIFKIKNNTIKIKYKELEYGKNSIIFHDKEIKHKKKYLISSPLIKKINNLFYYSYLTKNYNVIININENLFSNYKVNIKNLKNNTDLRINFNIDSYNEWEKLDSIVLRERKTNFEIRKEINNNRINLKANEFMEEGIYDFFINININNEYIYQKRIGRYRYLKSLFLKEGVISNNDKTVYISPYTTYKANMLSLKVNKTNSKYLEFFQEKNQKKYWIIGEQPDKAQDNGFYLFKYLRENYSELKVYYVINKNSKDYEKVTKIGNVIEFGTEEHYHKIAHAKYLISTHHPDYLFPINSNKIVKNHLAKKIFLQHGIMGTKNMANFYGKYSNNPFNVDMFIVSSEREKNMIVEDFEYEQENVRITGLARFDNLFIDDEKIIYDIVIIPTWRDWLQNEEKFEETEYYEKYLSLVRKLQKKYKIKFILHINMKQYKEKFQEKNIDVSVADEIDLQKIMKQSKLMLTDYSSVSFDFSFLEKPVIYYQFDQENFFGRSGSHFDIYKELPGNIVTTEIHALNKIDEIAKNNYKQNNSLKDKSDKLIKYKDTTNAKRIYEEIIKEDYQRKTKIIKHKLFKKAGNFYRRSKMYYPSIKLIYNLLKYLPKKELVLIESSNGKSITDSPKEIYLKWKELDEEQKFIMVYNQILPPKYKKNTKVVKRLSVKYFYYLARSKYWISNQNFPYYIKNHNTKYLQTWHGIPIKKMQHDVKEFVGRDEGYLKRVSKATKQWTYLISPNKYTTKCFETAFKHNAEVLELSYPRNNIFQRDNKKLIEKIKQKYNINPQKKIILFAPTFRDDGTKVKNKYIQDLFLDLNYLENELNEKYEFLIKLHPLAEIKNKNIYSKSKFYKKINDTEEINEIMLISDILITDYSSVMFDYLYTEKKTILYVPDLENYEKNNRGFYLDYKTEAPGIVVENQEDLIKEIKNSKINYDIQKYRKKYIIEQENEDNIQRIIDKMKEN